MDTADGTIFSGPLHGTADWDAVLLVGLHGGNSTTDGPGTEEAVDGRVTRGVGTPRSEAASMPLSARSIPPGADASTWPPPLDVGGRSMSRDATTSPWWLGGRAGCDMMLRELLPTLPLKADGVPSSLDSEITANPFVGWLGGRDRWPEV